MQEVLHKIQQQTGIDLVSMLADDLSGSALNSLLLEVYDRKAAQLTPAQLVRQYDINRFVQPAAVDVLQLREKELHTLQAWQRAGFEPLALSPVSLLGTCSVVGPVSQKKIISATRGTEVMADATNAMAIHVAHLKKTTGNNIPLRYCTTHRHVRTPPVKMKGHSTHFTIACCVTAGTDTGSLSFETAAISEHFEALQTALKDVFNIDIQYFKLQPREGYKQGQQLLDTVYAHINDHFPVVIDHTSAANTYYQGLQYKAVIAPHGEEIEIADGGFVSWTQQLLGNRKERFFITGLGIEFLSQIL
jgi:hypothetical protein